MTSPSDTPLAEEASAPSAPKRRTRKTTNPQTPEPTPEVAPEPASEEPFPFLTIEHR